MDLAEKAGLGLNTIKDIERGAAEGWPDTREAIATALGCTVADLYGGANDNKPTLSDAARLLLAYEKAPRHVRELVDRVLESGDIGDIQAAQTALSQFAQSLQMPKPKKS